MPSRHTYLRYHYISFYLYCNNSLISCLSTFILSEIEFLLIVTGDTAHYFLLLFRKS